MFLIYDDEGSARLGLAVGICDCGGVVSDVTMELFFIEFQKDHSEIKRDSCNIGYIFHRVVPARITMEL